MQTLYCSHQGVQKVFALSNVIKNLNKLLKQFLNYAVDEGYIIKNPCWGNKIVIPEQNIAKKDEIKIFTDGEISQLEKVLRTSRLKCLILTALTTGLRQGELLALTWDDIDLDKGEISVNKSIKRVNIIKSDDSKENKILIQPPKTINSNRIVPIPSELIPILKQHHLKQKLEKIKAGEEYKDNNFVFPTALGKPIDAKNLFRSYKNLLIKAGIEHKKFHCLRHTYASKLFANNIPLKTVQVLLGHSNIKTTADIYTHVMPKQKIDAAEKLNSILRLKSN
ncbi:site-specific integrase [Clostridium tyrobutyricum]|nr:site-specific integrase [Clostridium tyrobutyricum]